MKIRAAIVTLAFREVTTADLNVFPRIRRRFGTENARAALAKTAGTSSMHQHHNTAVSTSLNSLAMLLQTTAVPTGTQSANRPRTVNPYMFLVGCPRSGTTMLKRIVDAHPQIAITRETHWVPRFYNRRKGLTADGRVTPAIVEKWFEYDRFAHLEIKPRATRADGSKKRRCFIRGVRHEALR